MNYVGAAAIVGVVNIFFAAVFAQRKEWGWVLAHVGAVVFMLLLMGLYGLRT